jgi:hypothetical protein
LHKIEKFSVCFDKEVGEAGCVALASDPAEHVVRARVLGGGRRLLAPVDVFGTCLAYVWVPSSVRATLSCTRRRRAMGESGLRTLPIVLLARFKESPESPCVLRVRVFASAAGGTSIRSRDRTHPSDA